MKKLFTFSSLFFTFIAWSADGHRYFCSPVKGSIIGAPRMEIILDDKSLEATFRSPPPDRSYTQNYDRDLRYKARSGEKARFGSQYDYVIVSLPMLSGGMKMNSGQMGGFASVGGQADGSWNETRYVCFLR